MPSNLFETLRNHGVQPSAQRLAIAEFVLTTDAHPNAEAVLAAVRARLPMVSRATVYNTLHLFVEKGLLRELWLTEGSLVYDPNVALHHHFVDDRTGAVSDVPWDALQVSGTSSLTGFAVREYQVVLRGSAGQPGSSPRG